MSDTTLADKFNAFIRGAVLAVMTVAFCYKFMDGTVSTDAFISIFAGVLGWWFASRTQSSRAADKPTNGTPIPPTP